MSTAARPMFMSVKVAFVPASTKPTAMSSTLETVLSSTTRAQVRTGLWSKAIAGTHSKVANIERSGADQEQSLCHERVGDVPMLQRHLHRGGRRYGAVSGGLFSTYTKYVVDRDVFGRHS